VEGRLTRPVSSPVPLISKLKPAKPVASTPVVNAVIEPGTWQVK
jgi:hypothetical protein